MNVLDAWIGIVEAGAPPENVECSRHSNGERRIVFVEPNTRIRRSVAKLMIGCHGVTCHDDGATSTLTVRSCVP